MYKNSKTIENVLCKLTIVVPTLNRQNYALRLMSYWSGKGPNLIVLDGTTTPIDSEILRQLSPSINYIHKPDSIFERLRGSLDKIQTKYVMLASDDEFYIPSALATCINELENDDRLVACCGQCLGFEVTARGIFGFTIYPRLHNYALVDRSPMDRVVKHLQNYVPSLVYAVSRTNEWKKVLFYTLKTEFCVKAIPELQIEVGMAFAGNSVVVPQLMWLRSLENKPIKNTDPVNKDSSPNFWVWWKDKIYQCERDKFIAVTEEMLSSLQIIAKLDDLSFIVRAYDSYVFQYFKSRKKRQLSFHHILNLSKRFVRRLLPFDPPVAMKRLVETRKDLIDSAREMSKKRGISFDHSELSDIVATISEFHSRVNFPANQK